MTGNLPASKPHYDILDGLRGVAALGVVIFHFMECIYSDYSLNFIGHGFLAVDFFFCLSGFVTAYAYGDRIRTMSFGAFLKARLIRLHPLVVLGSVLGLVALLLDPFTPNALAQTPGRLVMMFICSVLLIPFGTMEARAFNLFALNAPSWSLFWEYVANILYGLILYRLHRTLLFCLLAVSAILLCLVFTRSPDLMGGWASTNFWDGGIRVSYSFLAGMLIHKCQWIIRSKLGFGSLAVLLSVAFLMPYSRWNWLTESLTVLLYFPLLVSLGAGAVLSPGLQSFCRLSGKMSYPLYMTHYAGIWIFFGFLTQVKPSPLPLALVVIVGIVFMLGLAYVTMAAYDIPVRRYLARKWATLKPVAA